MKYEKRSNSATNTLCYHEKFVLLQLRVIHIEVNPLYTTTSRLDASGFALPSAAEKSIASHYEKLKQ